MNAELIKTLKYLRMSNLIARWDEYLAAAEKGNFSPVRLLTHVLKEEYQAKRLNARERRLKQAKIPEILVMEMDPCGKKLFGHGSRDGGGGRSPILT